MNKFKYKILGLILIIVFPFSMLIFSMFEQGLEFPALFSLRRIEIMLRTIVFGGLVSVIACIIGWIIAYSLALAIKDKYRVMMILVAFMMLPPFLHSYLWMNLMYKLFGFSALSGMLISVLVQSLYILPLTSLLWYIYFIQINEEFFYEIRLNYHFENHKIMTLLTMSKGIYLLILGLVFILAITDFTIPSIFAFNTFPIEIMALFSSQSYLAPPLIISLSMICLTVSIFYFITKKIFVDFDIGHTIISNRLLYSTASKAKYYLIVALVLILIPFVLMIEDVVMKTDLFSILYQYREDYEYTIITSLIASIIIIVVSIYINYYLIIRSEMKRLVIIIFVVVFSMPNTIIGLLVNGYYNKIIDIFPMFDNLYYTMIPTIHLYVVKFLPIGFWILLLGFSNVSKESILQARLDSKNSVKILKVSCLYSLREYILIGFFINVLLMIGELGGSIMVVPPGKSTITITIYNYLHYGSTDIVSILSLGVTIMVFVLLLFMIQLLKGIYKER